MFWSTGDELAELARNGVLCLHHVPICARFVRRSCCVAFFELTRGQHLHAMVVVACSALATTVGFA